MQVETVDRGDDAGGFVGVLGDGEAGEKLVELLARRIAPSTAGGWAGGGAGSAPRGRAESQQESAGEGRSNASCGRA